MIGMCSEPRSSTLLQKGLTSTQPTTRVERSPFLHLLSSSGRLPSLTAYRPCWEISSCCFIPLQDVFRIPSLPAHSLCREIGSLSQHSPPRDGFLFCKRANSHSQSVQVEGRVNSDFALEMQLGKCAFVMLHRPVYASLTGQFLFSFSAVLL